MNKKRKKIKILFDISHGVHGSTGIQQDMRRILSVLAKEDKFEIDYLVYDMLNNVPYNTFKVSENLKRYGSLPTQSRLLFYFFNPQGEELFEKGLKGKILRKLYKRNLINNHHPETIILNKKFNPLIYRKLLRDGSDKELFRKFSESKVIMSIFSSEAIVLGMMKKNYKPPFLDTSDYDIAIFFQEFPIEISKNTIKVVRSFDLIQIFGPDVVFKADYKSNYQYKSIKECIKQDSWFLTISDTVANQIKDVFSTKVKIKTIPVAISDLFQPKEDHFDISKYSMMYITKRKNFNHKIPPKKFNYFLSVSTIEPRKNIITAYRAFKKLKMNKKYTNLKFVLVGKVGWGLNNSYYNMFADEDVILLENVPTEDLPYLYSNAVALIYIPLQEGFGVPPAEAMACGCPVILSDIQVHREIHGDGKPLFVNPYDVIDVLEKMKINLDKKNRNEIKKRIEAGLQHIYRYSIREIGQQWTELILNLNKVY